ncbi:MAG: hypothetical protein WCQ95_08315 [Bacteroidota bacterium]
MSNWLSVIQTEFDGDLGKAKAYGFGVRGQFDGHSESSVSLTNSYPAIVNIKTDIHLHLTIEMKNNENPALISPHDAKGIDVFLYESDEEPKGDVLKTAQYCGRAKRGKFTYTFTEQQVGKTVWLMATYVPKKGNHNYEIVSKRKAMVV